MADKELGALSPIEALLAAALFHTVQQGNSRKVTAQQIADFVNGNYPAFIQTLLSAQSAEDVYEAIGAAPEAENADRLGGHLPAFFASAQDVATAFEQLTKADVDLGNVDNTSDEDKPVSTTQQAALDLKVEGPAGTVTDSVFVQFDGVDGRKAKAAVIPTNVFIGRMSAGNGPPEYLTPSQARQGIGGLEPIGERVSLIGIGQAIWTGLAPFVAIYLEVEGRGNTAVSSGILLAQASSDNGSSWLSGANDYPFFGQSQEDSAITGYATTSNPFMALSRDSLALASLFTLSFKIGNFNKASSSMFKSETAYARLSGSNRQDFNSGYCGVAASKNAFRFACTGNAFVTGSAQLFGIRG
jgi:hypothetical protein